jgi:BioD-like phosphotransacetylase family protein
VLQEGRRESIFPATNMKCATIELPTAHHFQETTKNIKITNFERRSLIMAALIAKQVSSRV